MRSPIHEADADETIAPVEVFRGGWDALEGGTSVSWNHAVRTSLALEVAHQLADRLPGLVFKGGTPLQSRLAWPPGRASVDIDLEWPDADEVMEALHGFIDTLTQTDPILDPLEKVAFSHVTSVTFAVDGAQDRRIRVDISPPGSSTEFAEPWTDPPEPWAGTKGLQVPTLEAQAAQKLLLAAPPDFGRDFDHHLGRQAFCKDLFDLHCLGHENLDSQAVTEAAHEEVRTKSGYLEGTEGPEEGEGGEEDWTLDRVTSGANETYRLFAHPRHDCPEEVDSLWRNYLRVRPSIRAPFADGDLRKAAGCARHAVATLATGDLDWEDSWRPVVDNRRRRAWVDAGPIEPVVEVADGYREASGLLAAWADVEP